MSVSPVQEQGGWRLFDNPPWARRRREPTEMTGACQAPGCDSSLGSQFDLYCLAKTRPHFQALASRPHLQMAAANTVRALFGALVLFAAAWASRVPLYVGAGLAGVLLLLGPLRGFRTSRVIGISAWLGALLLSIAEQEGWLDGPAGDYVLPSLAVLAVIALLATAAGLADHDDDGAATQRALVLTLAVAVAAGILALVESWVGARTEAPLETWLWLVALGAVGAAVLTAAVGGVIRGASEVHYSPDFKPLRPFEAPQRPTRTRVTREPAGYAAEFAAAIQRALLSLATRVADLRYFVQDVARDIANRLRTAAVRCVRFVRVQVVKAGMLVAAATRDTVTSLWNAGVTLASILASWAKSTVLGLALFLAAGLAASEASVLFSAYLGHGPLEEGVSTLLLALAAACALTATWWTLTGWPPSEIARAARRSTARGAPALLITLVALGLITGGIGLLGYGPMRPGWLTLGGGAVILASLVYMWVTDRRMPASDPAT